MTPYFKSKSWDLLLSEIISQIYKARVYLSKRGYFGAGVLKTSSGHIIKPWLCKLTYNYFLFFWINMNFWIISQFSLLKQFFSYSLPFSFVVKMGTQHVQIFLERFKFLFLSILWNFYFPFSEINSYFWIIREFSYESSKTVLFLLFSLPKLRCVAASEQLAIDLRSVVPVFAC